MPRPGQYREVLIPGLKRLGETELADELQNQNIKLAISSSIQGPVQRRKELTPLFIDALQSVAGLLGNDSIELIDHYTDGLKAGTIVPVVNNCAEINARIADRVYAPGELFLTT